MFSQILKYQSILNIPKDTVINVNWIYRHGIGCISEAVRTNKGILVIISKFSDFWARFIFKKYEKLYRNYIPKKDFKIDAFELIVLWLIHEKQRGCRTDLRKFYI